VILFSEKLSPRLLYIADFIGKQLFDLPIRVTTNKEEFRSYNGPRINYSNAPISDPEYFMVPHTLLFEKGIGTQSIECFEWKGLKAFFKTAGDLSFDIFAASLYLLSRYEEYLPHQKDEYGRFHYKNSLAYTEDFLQQPLINKWITFFKDSLREKFPSICFHTSLFNFQPTYDIDEAWAYKNKSIVRNIGGIFKDILKGRLSNVADRIKVLRGKQEDPYAAYEWMNELHSSYELKPKYFFLVTFKNGKYDKGILSNNKNFRELIARHSAKYDTGIHPSWQSGDKSSLLKKEITELENITGKSPRASRQHYIRMTLPQTYRELIAAGIKEDYSMGYGSINGFRASVASTFYWFDLQQEETTELVIHPFCFMDANSFFEQKYGPSQALEEMRYFYKQIKDVNGTMITIWHNTFLGTAHLFKGWKEVYEAFIKTIKR
jgi:hypothetical protein